MAAHASASAAAVPEVPIASGVFSAWTLRFARRNSRAIRCRICCKPSALGGSTPRNSSVSRTAPSGRLMVSLIRLCSLSVISQLPPPRSNSRTRPPTPGSPLISP